MGRNFRKDEHMRGEMFARINIHGEKHSQEQTFAGRNVREDKN